MRSGDAAGWMREQAAAWTTLAGRCPPPLGCRLWTRPRASRPPSPARVPAVQHVALLPGTQALDYGRGLPNHLPDDRSAVPDLLHLIHREQQESAEETRRDEERREEENLIVRRDDEPRRSQRCEERRCQDDCDDPADSEHAESGRLDLDDDQNDDGDEQQEGDRVDAETVADEGQHVAEVPGDLGPVARRGDAEDHEIDPED